MKRNLLLSICVVACGLTASSHAQVKNNAAYGKIRTKAAVVTLTKAPEGKKTVYLMDLLTHDDAGGNIYDYHNEVAVTFCDNGDVYMPNFVSRKRMKGLLKGKLNLTSFISPSTIRMLSIVPPTMMSRSTLPISE